MLLTIDENRTGKYKYLFVCCVNPVSKRLNDLKDKDRTNEKISCLRVNAFFDAYCGMQYQTSE